MGQDDYEVYYEGGLYREDMGGDEEGSGDDLTDGTSIEGGNTVHRDWEGGDGGDTLVFGCGSDDTDEHDVDWDRSSSDVDEV
jgi:hypothetical protein